MNIDAIVITGVGLTSPIGHDLKTFRAGLLEGRSGIGWIESRYVGRVPAGTCDFEVGKYQSRKEARRGTRAGSISIYCANEALADCGLKLDSIDPGRVGVYVGISEHGTVETANEIANIQEFGFNPSYWTPHQNPRAVANNPAGEVTLNLGITGPHVCLGAACAAGNIGIVHGLQQLILGEVDVALVGGVSECTNSFITFASFRAQNSLAHHEDPRKASRPFDRDRNGLVVSEGGCLYVLERRNEAMRRGAKIYAEIAGYAVNTDATDFVLPNPERQARCMQMAMQRAGIAPSDVGLISTHATATLEGDVRECEAIHKVFGQNPSPLVNNTKSLIGHAMGAAGSLELAGNLPSFDDGLVHPTINVDNLDDACSALDIVRDVPRNANGIRYIMNNSFGMLGINAVLIVKRAQELNQ